VRFQRLSAKPLGGRNSREGMRSRSLLESARVLFLLLAVIAVPASASAPRHRAVLKVTFDGHSAVAFPLEYFDGERTLGVATDQEGVAVFDLDDDLKEWDLESASSEYVLRDLRKENSRWSVQAVRSATWRQLTRPRPCDEWRRTMDIPRGSLSTESAKEYDQWYASLSRESESNCILLAEMEVKVNSKAPWYFYEFKAMPPGCIDGKYVAELDWTAWYRRLLEEATGATPGLCVSNWEEWWAAKGYSPVPQQPSAQLRAPAD